MGRLAFRCPNHGAYTTRVWGAAIQYKQTCEEKGVLKKPCLLTGDTTIPICTSRVEPELDAQESNMGLIHAPGVRLVALFL